MTWRSRCCIALLCLTLIVPALHAAGADSDLAELEHYTLTTDKLTRFSAAYSDLSKLAKTNPKLAASEDTDTDSDKHESLADIEKRLSAHPEIVSIVKQHGFSTHEFVVAQMTIIQSAFALMAKGAGADPAKLASDAHVNPANITFLEQHKQEFEQLQRQLGETGKEQNGGNEQ